MMLTIRHNSKGVALLAALFVLMVMSILAIGMLSNVDEDLKISKNYENSERALKIAENGVQIARAMFFDPSQGEIEQLVQPVRSVNGFLNGGYFLTYLTSGFAGNEIWEQWRYNLNLSANNTESEITAPLFSVWASSEFGINGTWSGTGATAEYYVRNIYGVIATGVYFPIEEVRNSSKDTKIRTHHEYSGDFKGDRTVTPPSNTAFAANVSPPASYSRYKDRNTLLEQKLYFTYSGDNDKIDIGKPETSSTVRLRAVDLNVPDDLTGKVTDPKQLTVRWEFDTGLHGMGTAPTIFDPTPPDPSNSDNSRRGDEIIYFAVISNGRPMSATAFNGTQTETTDWNFSYTFPSGLNMTHDFHETGFDMRSYPLQEGQFPTQIYLFAVVDTNKSSPKFLLKWARPFPDPDVAEWTDYPTEHATGTNGMRFPFVGRPTDIAPYPLEDDFLSDYRDGPGRTDLKNDRGYDRQWNQVRGNIGGDSPSCSPPVLSVLYRKPDNTLTANYNDANLTAESKMNPIIDVYLMFAHFTRQTYINDPSDTSQGPRKMFAGESPSSVDNKTGWGGGSTTGQVDMAYLKPNSMQNRLIALRDTLVPVDTTINNTDTTDDWAWSSSKSRYPQFKWMYRVPGWDPIETDDIPATGYGQYSWDTWFDQHIAPMVIAQANNSDANGNNLRGERTTTGFDTGTPFDGLSNAGTQDLYPVVYAYYRSTGFPTGGGDGNNGEDKYNVLDAPKVEQGGLAGFKGGWDDTRIMVMAARDTWDDYIAGNRTNISGQNNANPYLSNPVEPYWYYETFETSSGPTQANYKYSNNQDMIVYSANYTDKKGTARTAPFPSGVQTGFPRPYQYSESLWWKIVRADDDKTDAGWGIEGQGWKGVRDSETSPMADNPYDMDIEGETAALCAECLSDQGLFVLPFNIDLTASDSTQNREDLRLHGINARTGMHVWDYHVAASQGGDNANNSPAIANNKVFMAYMEYGAEKNGAKRKAHLVALDASDGSQIGPTMDIDQDADAVIMPPAVANGMVYVATYDYAGNGASTIVNNKYVLPEPNWTRGGSDTTTRVGAGNTDDFIRLFAMSPIIRLVSTGIYPVGYKEKAAIRNYSTLTVDRDQDYANKRIGQSRRKLQVWVTGENSRWEEIKENIPEGTPTPSP